MRVADTVVPGNGLLIPANCAIVEGMRIPQLKEGQGRLVSRGDNPQEFAVSYRLNIITNMMENPGGEPTVMGIRSRGSVRALDGSALPLGHYDLHTDKEVIHLENTGMSWSVLM